MVAQLQKSNTQTGTNDPWDENSIFSSEDMELLDKTGALEIARDNSTNIVKIKDKESKALQLRELRNLVFNTPETQAIDVKTQPTKRALTDTRSKIDPVVAMFSTTVISIFSAVGMGVFMMTQAPNAQILKLATLYKDSSTDSMNALAAVSDRAVTEAGTDVKVDFCLVNCPPTEAKQPSQASPATTATAVQATIDPVATIPQGQTLNMRSEPEGKVISTIPSNDTLSAPIVLSSDRQWAQVRWNESNLIGWVSYAVIYNYYKS